MTEAQALAAARAAVQEEVEKANGDRNVAIRAIEERCKTDADLYAALVLTGFLVAQASTEVRH